jgi:hypothetical protein
LAFHQRDRRPVPAQRAGTGRDHEGAEHVNRRKNKTMNKVALRKTTAVANPVTADEAERYRQAKASTGEGPRRPWGNLPIWRLDGRDGGFTCYPPEDDDDALTGSAWVLLLPTTLQARHTWVDEKKIQGAVVGILKDLPPREELGHMDKEKWPLGAKGRPVDPVKVGRELEMMAGDDDTNRAVFDTGGKWQLNRDLGELTDEYFTPGHDRSEMPLVRFSSAKQVIDKKVSYFGKITLVKWVSTVVDTEGNYSLIGDDEPRRSKVEVISPKAAKKLRRDLDDDGADEIDEDAVRDAREDARHERRGREAMKVAKSAMKRRAAETGDDFDREDDDE